MRLVIHDDIAEKYEALGEDLQKIYDYGIAEAAKDYTKYVKEGYLSGNPMRKITGQLFGSVKFVRTKNIKSLSYTVLPGVGVKGNLNYLNRFIGTDKEFMAPSFKRWKDTKRIEALLQSNFEKEAKARGLM